MSKLSNVRGRITYISSHAKQEKLFAVYETTDRSYWTELARCNRQEFKKSGTEGKCIEARELIIALPESFPNLYKPDKLLKLFTDRFREKYGVECIAALHHNKRKTNYHIHLIFSERELLPQPTEKVATRNMFYDEHGKHVRTKKEILDKNGNIRKGCKIVKKGDAYERTIFTAKNRLFKQEGFVDEAKHFYTDLINLLVKDEKEKLHVFDRNGLYLATKKIGKNNPKAEQIQADNEVRMKWNREVDRALVSEVPEEQIRQIKQEYITDRIKLSVRAFGDKPERLSGIIISAVAALTLLIYKVVKKARELKAKLSGTELLHNTTTTASLVNHPREMQVIQEVKPEPPVSIMQEQQPEPTIQQTKPSAHTIHEDKAEETVQTPPKPAMPEDAKAYLKLEKIKLELDRQNEVIFQAEKERSSLEIERGDLKGLQSLTKKGALQRQINEKTEQIDILKAGLSGNVKRYGYRNVKEFYGEYLTAQRSYWDYQDRVEKWENNYGVSAKPKQKSMHKRIQEYQKKADEQNRSRKSYSKDRGGR